MHSRRARPTLRVLKEDLTSDWASPHPQRHLARGWKSYKDLHPLSELPHPIVTKAAESFGADPADDNYVGPISSSTHIRLLEIKNSQWRGGVWEDTTSGVCWLLVAGLAKGGHEDRDDFYQRIKRGNDVGNPSLGCQPTRISVSSSKKPRLGSGPNGSWRFNDRSWPLYGSYTKAEPTEWRWLIRSPRRGNSLKST
jgi:hypothetical protein